MTKRKIYIYCDAGFANRVNALIFGKYIAKKLDLEPVIFWPTNNWFGATYSDIFFSGDSETINEAIHQIDFVSMNCIGVLHDNIPRKFTGNCNTQLISDFSTEKSFFSYLTENDDKNVFLHTVLIPKWIGEEEISGMLRGISFKADIVGVVKSFLSLMPQDGFYGLHLRRTDLVSGLTDQEVFSITSAHRSAIFFVCSDSNEAEDLACYQPNCRRYPKNAYVQKRITSEPWDAPTSDDSGRSYNGNVNRSRQASIDAVVDFLILTHSTILGDSGSTFHALARRFGNHAKIYSIPALPLIDARSFSVDKKRFRLQAIDYQQAVNILDHYCRHQEPIKALELLFVSLQGWAEDDWNNLAIALSNLLVRYGRPELAVPILSFVFTSSPDRARDLTFGLGYAAVLKQLSRGRYAGELLDGYLSRASEAQLCENAHLISELFPGMLASRPMTSSP